MMDWTFVCWLICTVRVVASGHVSNYVLVLVLGQMCQLICALMVCNHVLLN